MITAREVYLAILDAKRVFVPGSQREGRPVRAYTREDPRTRKIRLDINKLKLRGLDKPAPKTSTSEVKFKYEADESKFRALNKLDSKSRREIVDAWNDLRERFPILAAKVKAVIVGKTVNSNCFGETQHTIFGDVVVLSDVVALDRASFELGIRINDKSHWSPSGAVKKGWGYILAHELGHVLHHRVNMGFTPEQIGERSRYSYKNSQEEFAEAFAASWMRGTLPTP